MELSTLIEYLNSRRMRANVFERAKEIAIKNKDVLEVIVEAVMHGARLKKEDLELAMQALVIDPQYFYHKGLSVVTPIGFYLIRGYSIDEIYSVPGTTLLVGEELFLHPTVQDYHEYAFGYLLEVMGPGEVALFTPCSKVKPYRDSFMYKKIEAILNKYGKDVWRFIVSEPLVIVPRYLDIYFPAAHYDYPPERVTENEYEIYVDLLAKAIEVITLKFEKMVYSLPKKHRKVFEDALSKAQVNALYTPYNVYFFPRLKEALISLTA